MEIMQRFAAAVSAIIDRPDDDVSSVSVSFWT